MVREQARQVAATALAAAGERLAGGAVWAATTARRLAGCPPYHPDELYPAEPYASEMGWWSIAGAELLWHLRRAAAGENPDGLYAELYANSEHDHVEGS